MQESSQITNECLICYKIKKNGRVISFALPWYKGIMWLIIIIIIIILIIIGLTSSTSNSRFFKKQQAKH